MRGREILKTLEQLKSDEHRIVKWWRKENDFADYDLIERFEATAGPSEEIEGFDLLTLEEMWDEVKRVSGNRVKLVHELKGDRVEWEHLGKTEVCVYTPETVLHIFDAETRGNPICS